MSREREYIIFTADGERLSVRGPTMRTALRRSCGAIEKRSAIVAAIEAGCLPTRPEEDRPFCAIFLSNPAFVAPEYP